MHHKRFTKYNHQETQKQHVCWCSEEVPSILLQTWHHHFIAGVYNECGFIPPTPTCEEPTWMNHVALLSPSQLEFSSVYYTQALSIVICKKNRATWPICYNEISTFRVVHNLYTSECMNARCHWRTLRFVSKTWSTVWTGMNKSSYLLRVRRLVAMKQGKNSGQTCQLSRY